MLDLGYVREHLDLIEKVVRDRGITLDLAPFREIDGERRKIIRATEQMKAKRNKASDEIVRLKKAGRDASAILSRMKEVSDEVKHNDERIAELDERLKQFLLVIPNIPHSSVPVGHSATDNVEMRRWGTPPKFDFAPRPHWEVGEACGILDLPAAAKIAAARFAVYKGLGARLERAIANFFLDVHTREHGYTEILPPFIVNTASLGGVLPMPTTQYAATKYAVVGLSQSLFLNEQALGTNVGVSLLCPGWVRTNIAHSERNWPARLGVLPQNPEAFEFLRQALTEAVEAGMEPSAVAAQVIGAGKQRPFWGFTHVGTRPAVAEHCAAVAEGRDPVFPVFTT